MGSFFFFLNEIVHLILKPARFQSSGTLVSILF